MGFFRHIEYGFLPGENNNDRLQRILSAEAEWKVETVRRSKIAAKTAQFIKRNKIQRPHCDCGASLTHAHHPSYEWWFLVAFLCRDCHRKEHAGTLGREIKVVSLLHCTGTP